MGIIVPSLLLAEHSGILSCGGNNTSAGQFFVAKY